MAMSRYLFCAIVAAFVVWLVFAVRSVRGQGDPPPVSSAVTVTVTVPVRELASAGLERRLAVEHRRVRALRRTLLSRPSTVEAINLACAVYGSCSTLWRRARCETGGSFSPRALNASSGAAGLFQFLPSTWATTPFARLSIWSPYASALAAGWMNANGRGGEWACR